MVWLRNRIRRARRPGALLLLALLLLALLLLAGCGGEEDLEFRMVFSTPAPGGSASVGAAAPVGSVQRLEFRTPSPEPGPTPTKMVRVFVPTATPTALPDRYVELGRAVVLTCLNEYRRLVAEYPVGLLFRSESAESLAELLAARRSDCGEGWAPAFNYRVSCVGGGIGGELFGAGLVRFVGSFGDRLALPTQRGEVGDVLIHFSRLPDREGRGCWYYSAAQEVWWWAEVNSEGTVRDWGREPVLYPICDFVLQDRILAGPRVRAADVARLVAEVRREYAGYCDVNGWNMFPRLGGNQGCDIVAPTGIFEDGSVVVNFHPDYPATDGSVCWHWSPEEGVWSASGRAVDDGAGG